MRGVAGTALKGIAACEAGLYFGRTARLSVSYVALMLASATIVSGALAQEALPTIDVESTGGDKNGTVGYLATRTSTATKSDTPLINVPQSVTVLTKDFIKDQNFQSIGDAIRYVPGVIPHQGEGNRDQVVIRGQNSSADFFINGIRDDVQYFRDLYNIQSIEVLKGPNAMIFGRGGGGGVINRVQKEADGTSIR
ncbi:MAG: catecholate siderophore receptor, partial [Afipia broomeae]